MSEFMQTKKPYKGIAMEGFIAKWYDKIRKSSPDQDRLIKKIRETLPAGGRILEAAPGPGYLAIELSKNYRVAGLDISRTFVQIAQENAKKAGASVDFQHGNASEMTFASETFDFLICVAAFKNFSEPLKALHEMHRVLKKGGHALIVDLRKDCSMQTIETHIQSDLKLRGLNALLTKWTFKHILLKNAHTRPAIENLVSQTRFAKWDIQEEGLGLDIYLTK